MTRTGAPWIVGGMALIAFSDNFVPMVAERMGLWQFHAVRSAMVLPLAVGIALATGQAARLWPRAPRRVAERSLMHVAALLLYFAALPAIGIAQAAAGLFTSPVWVVLLAGLFYGEPVGWRRALAAALGFAGVLLVLGVGRAPVAPMALAAVAAGLAYAMGVIWTRRHCREEAVVTLATWQFGGFLAMGCLGLALAPVIAPLLSGIEGTGFATAAWRPMTPFSWALVLGIGLAGILATACLAAGYQRGDASVSGLFDYSFLVWAPLFAWVVNGEVIGPGTALGMALLIAAGGLAAWSGRRRGGLAAGRAPRQ